MFDEKPKMVEDPSKPGKKVGVYVNVHTYHRTACLKAPCCRGCLLPSVLCPLRGVCTHTHTCVDVPGVCTRGCTWSWLCVLCGGQMANYWEPSKKLLNDPSKFLESLLNYDKDNIADSIIKKVEPYIQVCAAVHRHLTHNTQAPNTQAPNTQATNTRHSSSHTC